MIISAMQRRIGYLLFGSIVPVVSSGMAQAADCTVNGVPFILADPTFVANGSSVVCSGPGTLTGRISTFDEFEAASVTFSGGASLQGGNDWALSLGAMTLLVEPRSIISA